MSIYAIWSIIVLPFQTTAEINRNSIKSLFFPGKSKNASLKVSHHHHSDPDMVDGVTLLIKTQKNLKQGIVKFWAWDSYFVPRFRGVANGKLKSMMFFWWKMKTSLRKRRLLNLNLFSEGKKDFDKNNLPLLYQVFDFIFCICCNSQRKEENHFVFTYSREIWTF